MPYSKCSEELGESIQLLKNGAAQPRSTGALRDSAAASVRCRQKHCAGACWVSAPRYKLCAATGTATVTLVLRSHVDNIRVNMLTPPQRARKDVRVLQRIC